MGSASRMCVCPECDEAYDDFHVSTVRYKGVRAALNRSVCPSCGNKGAKLAATRLSDVDPDAILEIEVPKAWGYYSDHMAWIADENELPGGMQ